ncbi:malto-oligosyltrehalose trehalohydrolase, partial [Micromonospora deserti]
MTEFTVWAPDVARVRLRLAGDADHEMCSGTDGWWRVEVPGAGPGTDYGFLLGDDDRALPDPRSAWQPAGVRGPSRLYDHAAFEWTDRSWTGRQLPGSVLYELHVGTFTPDGTFDGVIGRLDHLVDLGIDMIELLAVNAVNGGHNRGYDGVCWYAPHQPYGGPDGLKRLVDAAHAKGLGVILDVVYHQFGPAGAYPPTFLGEQSDIWGRRVDLDGPHSDGIRRHVVDSVLMWLRDYHADGLRLDAVHVLPDSRATQFLAEVVVAVEALSTHLGRPLSLIAETDLDDPRLITPRQPGGDVRCNDEDRHVPDRPLTGERQGYHADFGSLECLADLLTGGLVHAGTWSSFRNRQQGRPVDRQQIPGHRFLAYRQNHDQIGNPATGDRISASLSPALLRVGAMLLLTAPFIPTLFMGEEWAASTRWQIFTSHTEPAHAVAVAAGRRREFAAHGWPEGDLPDPQDRQTFVRSRLDWAELDKPEHRAMYDFYRRLIVLRGSRPDLADPWLDRVNVRRGDQFLVMRRGETLVAANLAGRPQRITLPGVARGVLLATG